MKEPTEQHDLELSRSVFVVDVIALVAIVAAVLAWVLLA